MMIRRTRALLTGTRKAALKRVRGKGKSPARPRPRGMAAARRLEDA